MKRTLALAACLANFGACKDDRSGTQPAKPNGDSPGDICALLSKADVESVLGGKIGAPTPGKTSEYCTYSVEGTLKDGTQVSNGHYLDVHWNEHWTPVERAKKMNMMPVTTVGVDAWYNQLGTALEVSYRGGSLSLQLAAGYDTPDNAGKALGGLVELAKLALKHP